MRLYRRIVGSFVGTIPSFPRQNNILGLPVELIPEECQILIENGWANVLKLEPTLPEECFQVFKEIKEKQKQEYQVAYKEHRKKEITRKIDTIIEGKKRKMETPSELDKDQVINEEVAKSIEVNNDPLQFFQKCPFNDYQNITKEWHDLFDVNAIKYIVYKDLWQKGYFLTSGLKFGCHFLAYEGDPITCHAKFMVLCDNSKSEPWLIYGRLAGQVKKEVIIASLDSNKRVVYKAYKFMGAMNNMAEQLKY